MKPGIPWSVKGIEPEVREAAKHAARRAGMTLGEWLNSVILDQNEPGQVEQQPVEEALMQESFEDELDTGAAPQSHSSATSWRRPPHATIKVRRTGTTSLRECIQDSYWLM